MDRRRRRPSDVGGGGGGGREVVARRAARLSALCFVLQGNFLWYSWLPQTSEFFFRLQSCSCLRERQTSILVLVVVVLCRGNQSALAAGEAHDFVVVGGVAGSDISSGRTVRSGRVWRRLVRTDKIYA
ncbi:unnamed protein product [Scytosiphon promiscuus]